MMESYFTVGAFVLVCLVLLTLPFVPAFREWRHPSDFAPLPISANYSSDIDYFARRLKADAAARLGVGAPTGYEDFDFATEPVEGRNWSEAGKRLISKGGITSRAPICNAQPVYVEGSLSAGGESSFSALYATGDITLGARSEISDWAHADGVLSLGANSIALRRISAGAAIELGNEAWFERLHAPTLRFGSRASGTSPPLDVKGVVQPDQPEASFADLPGATLQTPTLFLIDGDCALLAQKAYRGSLIVNGFLTIGHGTTVIGDIKARRGISIGRGASVQGAVTCEKRVYVFQDAYVAGPLISESDVLIGASAVIGQLDAQTTVSASNIIVEDGVVVHGAVWAHEIGMVKAA